MNLVLMGPPGAGKGTQGEILSKRLDINTISTGVMLRTAIKEQSEIGKIAEKYINDGKLVPDDVIVSIVKERLQKPDCAKGFILDGFPRTTAQAEALTESGVKIDKVLSLEVADEAIIERLSSRRECSKCGAPYNIISNKPETEGICDKCKGELIQRADDVPETIKNRLNLYLALQAGWQVVHLFGHFLLVDNLRRTFQQTRVQVEDITRISLTS